MICRLGCLLVMLLSLSVNSWAAPLAVTEKVGQLTHDMERQSEALMDALLAKDHNQAGVLYQQMMSNLNALHETIAGQSYDERHTRELMISYSWMRLVAIDLKQGAWLGGAIAANQMRGEIIRYMSYADAAPRDLDWMDYLGRDIMLLAMEDPDANQGMIDLRKHELGDIWLRVRSDLIRDFRHKPLVMSGDQLMARLQKSVAGSELMAVAKDELKLVREIKRKLA